jgi:hypothetical protein
METNTKTPALELTALRAAAEENYRSVGLDWLWKGAEPFWSDAVASLERGSFTGAMDNLEEVEKLAVAFGIGLVERKAICLVRWMAAGKTAERTLLAVQARHSRAVVDAVQAAMLRADGESLSTPALAELGASVLELTLLYRAELSGR